MSNDWGPGVFQRDEEVLVSLPLYIELNQRQN